MIASAVVAAYDGNIRPLIDYTVDGARIAQPEWSRESVERHLMFASEFEGVFESWVKRSLQSMIVRVGSRSVTEEGGVCQVASKHFTTLVKAYFDTEKAVASSLLQPKGRKK